MWLNGHNLGRYPERIRVGGLYLPECWLVHGRNTLTVFDEAGNAPARVRLYVETAASREVIPVSQPCDPATVLVLQAALGLTDSATANRDNLAFDKPVRTSSAEADHAASAATDGNFETRWCRSSGKAGEWLEVDLQAATSSAVARSTGSRTTRSIVTPLKVRGIAARGRCSATSGGPTTRRRCSM